MPVQFEIDVTRSLVLTRVADAVSAADLAAYQVALAAHAQFSPHFDLLIEFRPSVLFDGTGEDVKRLAQQTPFKSDSKRAFVVADDVNFGLSRMAQEYSDMIGSHVEVFWDRESAMDWLDRKPAVAPQ